jgi:hypothetical protein
MQFRGAIFMCRTSTTDIEKSVLKKLATGSPAQPVSVGSQMRARQSQRIRELRQALVEAGFVSLDQQAAVLGLSRSTTWAVLRGNHKRTGLQAALIARMLTAPKLPQAARAILVNYVTEKSQGAYGHSDVQCQRFNALLKRLGLFLVGGGEASSRASGSRSGRARSAARASSEQIGTVEKSWQKSEPDRRSYSWP